MFVLPQACHSRLSRPPLSVFSFGGSHCTCSSAGMQQWLNAFYSLLQRRTFNFKNGVKVVEVRKGLGHIRQQKYSVRHCNVHMWTTYLSVYSTFSVQTLVACVRSSWWSAKFLILRFSSRKNCLQFFTRIGLCLSDQVHQACSTERVFELVAPQRSSALYSTNCVRQMHP